MKNKWFLILLLVFALSGCDLLTNQQSSSWKEGWWAFCLLAWFFIVNGRLDQIEKKIDKIQQTLEYRHGK